MGFLANNSASGAIYATLTRTGKNLMLSEGKINIRKFRLFDSEINYQLFNPDNIDVDDPNILALVIPEASKNDASTEYAFNSEKSKGQLLSSPYFVRKQTTLVGNRIIDSPFYAPNQEVILDIGSVAADPTILTPGPTSTITVSPLSFYSIGVTVGDMNNSVINNTTVSLYTNTGSLIAKTLQDTTNTIFSNLTANQQYKVVVTNQGWNFSNTLFSAPIWSTTALKNNVNIKFVGTPTAIATAIYSVSGTVTNGITSAAVTGLPITIHYFTVTQTLLTDSNGIYSFSGATSSLSSGTQFIVNPNTNLYYLDPSYSTTGVANSNQVLNFSVLPASILSGYIYYYNTTNPISNAVVNLGAGLTSSVNSSYFKTVYSDRNGYFSFTNINLNQNYNISATVPNYYFINSPIQLLAAAVTGSITSNILYAKKQERPVVPDSPFPRRRLTSNDKTDFPVFYDPCSWVFYGTKYANLQVATNYTYNPIFHQQVLVSQNYLDLINGLAGPYQFDFNTVQNSTNGFGNPAITSYISDNYVIKVCLYAMPYNYTLPENLPQWDLSSKSEKQITFPVQINNNAAGLQLNIGDKIQVPDSVPVFDNQQLAVNLSQINKIPSLLPRKQTYIPLEVSTGNAIPNLGLIASHGFNIDQSILKIQLTPNDLGQNGEYVTYTSIQGEEKTIPVEVLVDDFEEVGVDSIKDQVSKQSFTINGNPLPIFLPQDSFHRTQYFNANLQYPYSFNELIAIFRTSGYAFNRVLSYTETGAEYALGKESAYITITPFGQSRSFEELIFSPDGTHYVISSEFVQFLISYLGVTSNDSATINQIVKGQSLIDWMFYMIIIGFGAWYGAFREGTLSELLSIGRQARYAIVFDVIVRGKSFADIAKDWASRNYAPTTSALDYFRSLPQVSNQNFSQQTVAQANVFPQDKANPDFGRPIINNNPTVGPSNFTPTQNFAGPTAPQSPIQGGNINFLQPVGNNVVNNNANIAPVDVIANITAQYGKVARRLSDCIIRFTVTAVFRKLYSLVGWDITVQWIFVINTIGKITVHNVVRKPVKSVKITTQTIKPIVCRAIQIKNANNYFNINPNLKQRLKLRLSFDLTNPATQDNFVKMINYLNDKLYTIYLGVEIIDNGIITQNLNNLVYTNTDYLNSITAVQNAFCTSDKMQFLVPLTVGGIKQSTSQVVVNDPSTFHGIGFVKFIPVNATTAHLLRIVKLSDIAADNVNLINPNVITGSDYVAFELLEVKGYNNLDFARVIPRIVQALNTYSYSTMNQDINQLRQVLGDAYKDIANISHVGSFGPAFASSTKGPIFWNSSIVDYPQGATPVSVIQNILATGLPQNIGSQVKSINDFRVGLINV